MILVFGKTGQVARALRRQAEVTALDRAAADLAHPGSCAAAITGHRPDLVINAAAYTAVDRAEEEEALAQIVNADAPAAMARACADLDIPFMHLSTEYVFDGSGTAPWQPDSPVRPLNAYGRSKAAGEAAIAATGARHVILRTSWVFSGDGNNFVKTMLRLARTRSALDVVDDQIGGPTPAAGIANALLRVGQALQDGHPGGIHHYAGAPAVSWARFARETFACAGRDVRVTGIPTSAYPTPARRPLNSRLDCSTFEAGFGLPPADWRTALADTVRELTE